MNLIDIRNKLRDNLYSCPEEFEHDLLLVICNAVMYYPLGSPSNKIVRNIYDNILPLLEVGFVICHLIFITCFLYDKNNIISEIKEKIKYFQIFCEYRL